MAHKAIGYFEKERQAVEALLAQVPEERWAAVRREDGWTAVEILGHMAAATDGLAQVARYTLEHGRPSFKEPFDIDRFNEGHHRRHAGLSLAEIRAEWEAAAGRVADFLSSLSPEQWQHPASTPWGLGQTVEDVMLAATYHLRSHRLELEALLRPKESGDAHH
ncbi:MAG: hypothetical protein KatS3mg057_0303 [Herpetosiphonaceae bacterium]|nr:MAG: hypothetical protein KatS3mg057_0303 [Herpetosiphonaceae bacterium]